MNYPKFSDSQVVYKGEVDVSGSTKEVEKIESTSSLMNTLCSRIKNILDDRLGSSILATGCCNVDEDGLAKFKLHLSSKLHRMSTNEHYKVTSCTKFTRLTQLGLSNR